MATRITCMQERASTTSRTTHVHEKFNGTENYVRARKLLTYRELGACKGTSTTRTTRVLENFDGTEKYARAWKLLCPRTMCVHKTTYQGDRRRSGPPLGQDAGGGARTCDKMVLADLRGDSLRVVPPTTRPAPP
ncbi:hypothetical protein PoB_002999200 [Plakobranchus ocellatus]|uniref:Uncharacterized protein n=1 Tax=Plakobranchus ocellatus TaxID=259542 RepID=A0AAV4A8A4_9GAST|nr:hypothetical protein PoB_002999200 [Plakobranchus ocellatus]